MTAGRCAVVVPEGLLFDSNQEYVRVRKLLVEKSNLFAVIRLHSFVFKPYTGQPTSILFFEKGKQTDKVWFFDVKEDGFKKTGSKKGRRKIVKDDLIRLRQIWKEKPRTESSFYISAKEIRENNYRLSMNNYLKPQPIGKTVRLKELLKNQKIIIGFTPSRNDDSFWFGGQHTWVKAGDIKSGMYINESEECITDQATQPDKLLPKDTLLFSFKLSIGKVAIAKKPLYTNEAIAGLIVDDPIIRKYLYYILPTLDFETNRAAKGETLNKESVENLKIPFFDRKKIESLVARLDKIQEERADCIKRTSHLDDLLNKTISKALV